MNRIKKITLVAIIGLVSNFVFGQVAFGPSAQDLVKAELVSENETVKPGETAWVGVGLTIKKDWHTYWKNAGEAGFGTNIQWDLPEGFKAGEIIWPTPKKFYLDEYANYGYENFVLHIVPLHVPADAKVGETVTLKAHANWLACETLCIPGEEDLELEIMVANETPKADMFWKPIFDTTRAKWPLNEAEAKVEAVTDKGKLALHIKTAQELPDDMYFFTEQEIDIEPSKAQILTKVEDGYVLELPEKRDFEPEGKTLRGILYKSNGWNKEGATGLKVATTIKTAVIPQGEVMVKPSTAPDIPIAQAIILAFIGGLILNLMPCVFPVIGLKIMGFIKHSHDNPWKIKMHGISFTLGVLVSFWALSGLLIALRAGGQELGWGFQLQSPYFISFLILLLTLVALNFSGVFEIGTSLMGIGGKVQTSSGYGGTFFSGILATALATPCTAPFMGTALGFALAQPAIVSLGIFTSLALGMSTPYVVLTWAPKLVSYLPKPGAWMETFKQAMAFLLWATLIWLIWVFAKQTSIDGSAKILFAILALSVAAWIYGRFVAFSSPSNKKRWAGILSIAFLLTSIECAYWAATTQYAGELAPTKLEGLAWEEFTPELLEKHRKEGRAIYIDFSASWCLTCQFNKKNVFSSDEVIKTLKEKNFVMIFGDWTRRDADITKALEGYGRSGVPTNVIYPAKPYSDPIVLPEILTPDIVLNKLKNI